MKSLNEKYFYICLLFQNEDSTKSNINNFTSDDEDFKHNDHQQTDNHYLEDHESEHIEHLEDINVNDHLEDHEITDTVVLEQSTDISFNKDSQLGKMIYFQRAYTNISSRHSRFFHFLKKILI